MEKLNKSIHFFPMIPPACYSERNSNVKKLHTGSQPVIRLSFTVSLYFLVSPEAKGLKVT